MNSAKKKSFLVAVVCLILCVALLVGTTFAWFSDSVSNTGNRIQAGNLKIDLLKHNGTDYVTIANGTGDIFTDSISSASKWEPGQTQFAFLAVENKGNLALKYNTYIDVTDGGLVGSLEYALVPVSKQEVDAAGGLAGKTWADIKSFAGAETGDIAVGRTVLTSGVLDEIAYDSTKTGERDYAMLAVHMKEDAGNQYQNKNIIIDVTLAATQYTAEEDGFGSNQYDAQATPVAPEVTRVTGTGTIPKGGDAKAEIVITDATQNPKVKATIPSSDTAVKFKDINNVEHSVDTAQHDTVLQLDVVAGSIQADSVTYDITMKNVTDSYTVKTVNKVISIDLSIGKGLKNVTVAHNGIPMEKATTGADQTYSYDSASGIVKIYTSSFSPFTVGYDYEADVSIVKEGEKTEYTTLYQFRDSVNNGKSYAGYTVTLLKNVTLSGEWKPIGTESNPFAGSFDGNNKTISGLNITTANSEGTGLFGYVSNDSSKVTFKNLTLKDVSVNLGSSAGKNVGAFIGYVPATCKDILVDNVDVTGTSAVTAKSHAGGVIGKIYAKNAVLQNCDNYASVACGSMYGGGIVAITSDSVQTVVYKNCKNYGAVSGTVCGGIVGRTGSASVSFEGCVNSANVSGASYSGGVAGSAEGTVSMVVDKDTVNTGTVTGSSKGLLIGYASKYTAADSDITVIRNSNAEYCDTADTRLMGSFTSADVKFVNAKMHALEFTTSWKAVVGIELDNCIVDDIKWVTSSGEYGTGSDPHANDGEYLYLNGSSNSTVSTLTYCQQYAFYKNYYSFKDITGISIINDNSAPLVSVEWHS